MKHNYNTVINQTGAESQQNPFHVKEVAFSPKVFKQIRETIGSRPAESGGALFVKAEELVSGIPYIREFVFDKGSAASRVEYTIDDIFVNKQIHFMDEKYGLIYAGQIHSHPCGVRRLSSYDLKYFHDMHSDMERPFIITPVIFSEKDCGEFQMFVYLVGDKMQPVEVGYSVMDEDEYQAAVAKLRSEETSLSEATVLPVPESEPEEEVAPMAPDTTEKDSGVENKIESETTAGADMVAGASAGADAEKEISSHIDYSRERGAVNPDRLANSKVVIVGAGGSYCLNGMLARSGVGEIVDIDPDSVDATNICRQGYLLRQVGMKKVDALGEHIREINPDTKYSGYAKKVQDLTFGEIMQIMDGASLIIAATDSFEAQAFVNKLALLFNVPAIFAGFYEKSLASEIIFWIPGVTEACFRCIASSRYKFQEEYKEKNGGKGFSVSSDCNTIFHSELLDAQVGMLAMAILHNDAEGLTFSGWFGERFDQNILQTRVSPEYKSNLFDKVFPDDRTFLFNSVWQHAKAEVPPEYELCPDCHGKGVQPDNMKTR